MHVATTRFTVARGCSALLALGPALMGMSGCSGAESARVPSGGTTLTARDFASPALAGEAVRFAGRGADTNTETGAESAAGREVVVSVESEPVAEAAWADGAGAVRVTEGAPATSGDAQPAGDAVLVDTKVGDINGKAIYASAFFEPMARRLVAESATRPLPAWRQWAGGEIARELQSQIEDELLRAEALARLTPEERQGFFAFIERVQRDFQRERGGSRAQADRALAREEGITIDQWRRRREDLELIRFQLSERILRRVNVGARDIEQRYAQLAAEFNKPDLLRFRVIQVPKENQQAIDQVKGALEGGESFAEVAALPANVNKRVEGGLEPRDKAEVHEEGDYFANPALNGAARTVGVGEVVGPIELSATVAWLTLDSVEVRKLSLAEAQLVVEDRVRSERIQRERVRYMNQLRSRSGVIDAERMLLDLLAIAEERYYRPEQARARTPAGASRGAGRSEGESGAR